MALVLTRRLQPLHGLIDLAPMVNVVLLLLCFFLLGSSFVLQPGIKVDPPRSVIAVGTPASNLICAVAMGPQRTDASGAVLRDPVLYFNDQIVTLDGLRAQLDALPASRVMPNFVIKADKEVPVSLITQITDIAAQRFSVVIATQPVTGAQAP
jgi:biopolymer transport protein ExbD